jgi:hypothetical protein
MCMPMHAGKTLARKHSTAARGGLQPAAYSFAAADVTRTSNLAAISFNNRLIRYLTLSSRDRCTRPQAQQGLI